MNIETVLAHATSIQIQEIIHIYVACTRILSRYIAHDNPNRDEHNKRRMKEETEE